MLIFGGVRATPRYQAIRRAWERIPDLQPVGKGCLGVCSSSVC